MSCCSGSSFTPAPDAALDPEKRVNFTFGMVLGVDDFRQEHAYLAGRDERALRETIGYGVLAGLDVSCEPTPPADKSKYTVRVAPGLAVLPNGKQVGVPVEQCAALTEWLGGANEKKTSKETGAFPVYVVLRHAETSGTPVPIPGEPCRDESALLANSRIANSFAIDFSWQAPASTEDNALRSFAAWLRAVPVHNAPAPASSLENFQEDLETALNAAITAGWPAKVEPPLSQAPLPPATKLVIPHERYAEFITAAFDVWIRLRPKALAANPPLARAEADPALLLAAIDIKLKDGLFESFVGTRQLGRPQLAHLRLLQEWLFTRADEAPRDASYVLGKADPRLPAAQDLHAGFKDAARKMARVEIVDGKGLLKPAVVYPGTNADYYGPGMDAPIPVGDGGTGVACKDDTPEPGQLLVGATEGVKPRAFALGWLKGTPPDATTEAGRNIIVDVSQAPNILLDTVQNIDAAASPSFVGLSLSGNLAVSGTATIQGATTLGGTATVSGLLTASGNITTPSLTISGLTAGLVGSNSSGLLANALPWDGQEANLATVKTYYYAPGQGHAVRIADGGTGLTAGPAPLQVLVGRNDSPATPSYALATLEAGSNVALTLSKSNASPPQPDTWKLTISATGGGISNLAVGNRGKGPNLVLTTSATAQTLDTIQDLHATATPTFEALRLSKPSTIPPTHGLGWNSDKRNVVVTPLPITRTVTVVDAPDKFPLKQEEWEKFLTPGDHVLVHALDQDITIDSLPPPPIDGQMLILKVHRRGGPVVIKNDEIVDVGTIEIKSGSSITLVGSVALKQWLLVGRS